MPLEVLHADLADVPELIRIKYAAMGDQPFHKILWGVENTPETRAVAEAHLRKDWGKDPAKKNLKCVDTETGEIVGYAGWAIYEHERPESEWKKMPEFDWLEGAYREAADEFIGLVNRGRQEYFQGRPICVLNLLVTDPRHQRRGVGSALLKWGTDRADELGLESWLEATPKGLLLYETKDYHPVGTFQPDVTPWLGKIPITSMDMHTRMLRQPKSKGS